MPRTKSHERLHCCLLAFVTEIYEKICFDGNHKSFAAIEGMAHRTLTVNGFSKVCQCAHLSDEHFCTVVAQDSKFNLVLLL